MYVIRNQSLFLSKSGKMVEERQKAAQFETAKEAKTFAKAKGLEKFSTIPINSLIRIEVKRAAKTTFISGSPFPHYSKPLGII